MKIRIEKFEVEIDERLIDKIAQAIVMVDASQEQTRSQADDSHRSYLMHLVATFIPLLKDILNPPPPPPPTGRPPFRPRRPRPVPTPEEMDAAMRDIAGSHPAAVPPFDTRDVGVQHPPIAAEEPPEDDEPWRDGSPG